MDRKTYQIEYARTLLDSINTILRGDTLYLMTDEQLEHLHKHRDTLKTILRNALENGEQP